MADINLIRGRMVYSIERNINVIDESILSMWICISDGVQIKKQGYPRIKVDIYYLKLVANIKLLPVTTKLYITALLSNPKNRRSLIMLYMVFHKHTAEMCPGGNVRPDKEFLTKLNEQIKDSGVNLIEGYLDGPGHEFYLVIEADDIAKLNSAIEQLRLVGDTNKIVPVMKFSDAAAWARKMGIQK
jgi:uncharacterized protein with GYD domain